MSGAASSAAGGGGGGGALSSASAAASSIGSPSDGHQRPPPGIRNHCAFEVLGLGASASAGHRLNLLIVTVVFREGAEQLLSKDGRLLRFKPSSIMVSFRRACWLQVSDGSLGMQSVTIA